MARQRDRGVSRKKPGIKVGTKFSDEHKAKILEGARRFWSKIKKLQAAAEANA